MGIDQRSILYIPPETWRNTDCLQVLDEAVGVLVFLKHETQTTGAGGEVEPCVWMPLDKLSADIAKAK